MSSGLWYRTLVYLGLKEEPEEGYDDLPERNGDGNGNGSGSGRGDGWGDDGGASRHDRFDPTGDPDLDPDRPRGRHRSRGDDEAAVTAESNVRPLRATDAGHARGSGGGRARLSVVEVEVFEDVETVGARYRDDRPVLFDLSSAERATARRVVDFVSGLTYASHGRMHKVGTRAFLLVPEGVRLPDDEVRRLGYHLPTGSDV